MLTQLSVDAATLQQLKDQAKDRLIQCDTFFKASLFQDFDAALAVRERDYQDLTASVRANGYIEVQSKKEHAPWSSEEIEEAQVVGNMSMFKNYEIDILLRFFSNVDRHTFFVYGMPAECISTLISMYSRIKNPRGLRGLFLDNFLEYVHLIDDEGNGVGFDPEHIAQCVTSDKISKFMSDFLDKYGHNSIARTGCYYVCCERVTTLTAKHIEDSRPGIGFLELSTRYVDMSRSGIYPIGSILGKPEIDDKLLEFFDYYKNHVDSEKAHFSELAKKYGQDTCSNPALVGKMGDSLGNLLPVAVYTSVGYAAMGESMQGVISHLMRSGFVESAVVAYEITLEAARVGTKVILGKYYPPTDYNIAKHNAGYLSYDELPADGEIKVSRIDFSKVEDCVGMSYDQYIDSIVSIRDNSSTSHEKLPREFESEVCTVTYPMSFRSWRDTQRHGMSMHQRALLEPNALYLPTDMTPEFYDLAHQQLAESQELFESLDGFSPAVKQLVVPLGVKIPAKMTMNLRQLEFMTWQRGKMGVHAEIREQFVIPLARHMCSLEGLRWDELHRTDMTESYFFARGDSPFLGSDMDLADRRPDL